MSWLRFLIRTSKLLAVSFIVLLAFGCARPVVFEVNSYKNEPIGSEHTRESGAAFNVERVPAASLALKPDTFPNNVIIGIAISGGGSRAANFASGVLQELDTLGVLQNAGLLSCVSGGCLPAAYYALNREQLDWRKFRAKMATDFFGDWLLRLASPHNLARLQFTDFDRSDLMAEVFQKHLFGGKTFDHLPKEGGPRLLINASTIKGTPFVFSAENFTGIGARLDTYPIANAVMASGAFPGVFNNVTLARFRDRGPAGSRASEEPKRYVHLYDGGPSDNLGLRAQQSWLDNAVASAQHFNRKGFKACLLILIDAFPGEAWEGAGWQATSSADRKSDLRPRLNLLVDQNVLDATDSLLAGLRYEILASIRENRRDWSSNKPFWEFLQDVEVSNTTKYLKCKIWHITFERLTSYDLGIDYSTQPVRPAGKKLRDVVSSIATHYRLTGPEGCSPEFLQSALYEAARRLVREDASAVNQLCDWLDSAGLDSSSCHALPLSPQYDAPVYVTEEGTLACHPPQ